MPNTDSDLLAILRRVSVEFERLCSSVDDDQLNLLTPARDWHVGQLVDHVTGGNRFTLRILGGDSKEDAMASAIASFDSSHHPGAAAIQSIRAQMDAFSQPDALGGSYHHVAGWLPGHTVLRLRLHDLIIHLWDLGETIDPPATIPDELVRWAVADLVDPVSPAAQHFEIDTSALATAVDQSPQQLLLTAFGR